MCAASSNGLKFPGLFITFEGTEGGGKSTQTQRLSGRLQGLGFEVVTLREPGGTPIGEEIRHTLKHSPHNGAMTPEAELLLMNASRAQLVREVIQPALNRGAVVLCDRFYDSTIVYQGYGRGLDPDSVRSIIEFAVGETHPDITLLLSLPVSISEDRRALRSKQPEAPVRDRFEEADRDFFLRVEQGYQDLAASDPDRIKVIDATQTVEKVEADIWAQVQPCLVLRS